MGNLFIYAVIILVTDKSLSIHRAEKNDVNDLANKIKDLHECVCVYNQAFRTQKPSQFKFLFIFLIENLYNEKKLSL